MEDLTGIAAVITALSLPFAAYLSYKALTKSKEAVSLIEANNEVTEESAKKILQIDNAVNGREPGTQTIGEQVDDLHNEIPPKVVAPTQQEIDAAIHPMVAELYADLLERRKSQGLVSD